VYQSMRVVLAKNEEMRRAALAGAAAEQALARR
jgi:hypothetical protein